MLQNVSGYEQEVRRIRKDAADRDSQQRDIVQRAAKVRGDYDRLKAEYDVEYKENLKKLEELRAAVAEKAIPYCSLVCITGADMKTAVSGYLQTLYDLKPETVGGAMPDDGFYWMET